VVEVGVEATDDAGEASHKIDNAMTHWWREMDSSAAAAKAPTDPLRHQGRWQPRVGVYYSMEPYIRVLP
jgi:hypothetical protein